MKMMKKQSIIKHGNNDILILLQTLSILLLSLLLSVSTTHIVAFTPASTCIKRTTSSSSSSSRNTPASTAASTVTEQYKNFPKLNSAISSTNAEKTTLEDNSDDNNDNPEAEVEVEVEADADQQFKQHIKQLCNERNYPFEKVKNARDLSSASSSSSSSSSTCIQPGRIIRTGRISDATTNDLNVLNNQIKIKTLVDLRSYTELKDDMTLDRQEVYGDFKDLVWDERKNVVKVLNEGRSRVETKRNIVSHVKELMSGAKKGVEVATHSHPSGEDDEKPVSLSSSPSSAADVGILKVLSSAADLAEVTNACKDGDCGDDDDADAHADAHVDIDTAVRVLSNEDAIYENQEDESESGSSNNSNINSKRFIKTYKCEDLFKDESRSNDRERHFVSIMNELKYVKGTLSKVRKRDLAKVIMKSPGAIVSKRVRSSCKGVFLDKINAGGLILLNELLLKQAAPGIKHVLDLCKDRTRHPIAFYCTAGKDRTGAIAAIMLAAAGIPDEDIVEDYSLSANVYAEMNDHKAMVGALSQRNLDAKTFLGAPPEVMERTLENIRESYGSIEGYLDSIGFDEQDRKELRSALLDE